MQVSGTALAALFQAIERVDEAAENVQHATQPRAATEDYADLSSAAVRLLIAKNGYDAAITLAKTADEIDSKAIDLLG